MDLKSLVVTQEQFGNFWNVTSRTVRNKITEGMPTRRRRGIPFFEASKWWQRNVLESGEGESLTDLKIQKIKIENELKMLQLMIQRGELLPRAEVVQHNVATILEVKGFLLALSRTLPPKLISLDPREMANIIKQIVLGALKRFHEKIGREKF